MENLREKVQELIERYQNEGDAQAANDAFQLLCDYEWSDAKLLRTASKIGGTKDDALSLYGEKYTQALEKYVPKMPFVHYINRVIRNAEIDAGQAYARQANYEYLEGQKLKDVKLRKQSDLAKMTVTFNTFDYVEEGFETVGELTELEKESKQKQVVAKLIDEVGEFEMKVATLYMELGSYGKVAEALGTNKMRVMRAMERMRKTAEKYVSDVGALFTVDTVTSRGGAR